MPQYTLNPPLTEAELLPDPLDQLQAWLAAAVQAGMIEPTAMTLATADEQRRPSARIVLCKGIEGGAIRFFTSYESRKGRELECNPEAALVFWWDRLERQVRLEGRVDKLPRQESERYFRSRPRESQLGALTSRQSAVVASRAPLDERFEAHARRYAGQEIPFPESWGGYRFVPRSVEFWQGRLGRLHDRLRYRRQGADWIVERLEP